MKVIKHKFRTEQSNGQIEFFYHEWVKAAQFLKIIILIGFIWILDTHTKRPKENYTHIRQK